jgi:hypothetical protein
MVRLCSDIARGVPYIVGSSLSRISLSKASRKCGRMGSNGLDPVVAARSRASSSIVEKIAVIARKVWGLLYGMYPALSKGDRTLFP